MRGADPAHFFGRFPPPARLRDNRAGRAEFAAFHENLERTAWSKNAYRFGVFRISHFLAIA
jgi:hypothetical protein